jgi:MFS superfamily sulfate permease-like transporter
VKNFEIGYEQLVVFVVTIIGVLATDLLIGVGIGIVAEFIIHVLRSVRWNEVLKLYFKIEEKTPGVFEIKVDGAAFFANFLSLKSELSAIPGGKNLIFDLSETETIDHTVMEFIHDFCEDYGRQGGHAEILGLDQHVPASKHPLAPRKRMAPAQRA